MLKSRKYLIKNSQNIWLFHFFVVPLPPMNQKKKRERITDAERKDAYKEASKFVLDIAKLVFAGVILSTITGMNMSEGPVIAISSIVLAVLIMFGAYLYYVSIKKY